MAILGLLLTDRAQTTFLHYSSDWRWRRVIECRAEEFGEYFVEVKEENILLVVAETELVV